MLVLVTLGVTMLVGCSREQPERPAVLPPVQAASPGPTATVSAPSAPAATTSAPRSSQSRDEQLVAAATEWYEAIKRSYATLDSSELEALSHPDCRGCQRQIALVEDAAEQKHRYELGEFRITKTRILGKPTAEKGSIRVERTFEGLKSYDRGGGLVRDVPHDEAALQLDLVRQGDRWLLREVLRLEES
ncbi:MAG: hypothetical protein M3P96_07360 [Actinomycetota bacterium]|nr:hypothetical protein [Actinomycetota bacterium]